MAETTRCAFCGKPIHMQYSSAGGYWVHANGQQQCEDSANLAEDSEATEGGGEPYGTGTGERFDQRSAALFRRAVAEAMRAGKEVVPRPLVVYEPDALDGVRTGGQQYYLSEGETGEAWVDIAPSPLSAWMTDHELGLPGRGGSVRMPMTGLGDAVVRKQAAAEAFATVLRASGVEATVRSG